MLLLLHRPSRATKLQRRLQEKATPRAYWVQFLLITRSLSSSSSSSSLLFIISRTFFIPLVLFGRQTRKPYLCTANHLQSKPAPIVVPQLSFFLVCALKAYKREEEASKAASSLRSFEMANGQVLPELSRQTWSNIIELHKLHKEPLWPTIGRKSDPLQVHLI